MPTAQCGRCGEDFQASAGRTTYCRLACYVAASRERSSESLIDRFWAKVKRGPNCWLWTAATIGGYGQFHLPRVDGRNVTVYAHRFSWALTNGAILDNLSVLHKCDVPLCVNPNHLFLGTQQDNLVDARAKGRVDTTRPRTRVLTPTERLAIYHEPRYLGICVDLAREFGVTKACISQIRNGRFKRPDVSNVQRVPSVQLPILGEVA